MTLLIGNGDSYGRYCFFGSIFFFFFHMRTCEGIGNVILMVIVVFWFNFFVFKSI